jgi:hypothetical protein
VTTDYNDDYPTCFVTYADLRIYHDDLDPDRITGLLGIEPSWAQVKGRAYTKPNGREFTPPIGGWFLSTKGVVGSRDVRRHVDWILDRLAGKDEILKRFQAEGHQMSVFCLWQSVHGHGGPILSPEIMRRLGEMELEIGFDIFHPCED